MTQQELDRLWLEVKDQAGAGEKEENDLTLLWVEKVQELDGVFMMLEELDEGNGETHYPVARSLGSFGVDVFLDPARKTPTSGALLLFKAVPRTEEEQEAYFLNLIQQMDEIPHRYHVFRNWDKRGTEKRHCGTDDFMRALDVLNSFFVGDWHRGCFNADGSLNDQEWGFAYILDTETGKVWHSHGKEWEDMK